MVIRLRDIQGNVYDIRTKDTKLVAEWFKEYIPFIMADHLQYNAAWAIEIYADDNSEMALMNGVVNRRNLLDAEGLADVEKLFRDARLEIQGKKKDNG